jgi:2-(1,2-epoxy-1,2-dihydrophenyl)acetyl-CoA isomerase
MSDAAPLIVEVDGPVHTLTFDRPESANALSLALAEALLAAVRSAIDDESCAVVVLAGNDRFFCAGGDVSAMVAADDPSEFVDRLAATMHTAVLELRGSTLVVIAAVAGVAAGAGVGLAFSADLAVCAESARFVPAYLGAGLSPDCGVSYFLSRVAGPQRAASYLLGGQKLTAAVAADWGLVALVLPDEEFSGAVRAMAHRLASGQRQAWAETKPLLEIDGSLADHLDRERASISALAGHPDTLALLSSFAAK